MIKTIIYLFLLLLINTSLLAQPNPETGSKNGTMRIRKKKGEDKTITTGKAKKGAEQKATDLLKKITF